MGEQHLSGSHRKVLRAEAAVIGDHHALRRCTILLDHACHTLCEATNIFKGELVADLGAPAIRTEEDLRWLASTHD